MKIKDLYDLGFAIHLLQPRSKMPVESGWTKGPRAEWGDIQKKYKKEMNVGTRLGSASRLSNGFLCVIDCDVKSDEVRHRAELDATLGALFGNGINRAPEVLTGRGNGSRHIYIVTNAPVKFKRVAKSADIVKVKMPSSEKPSKRELETLTKDEIESGVRLRAAWEVAVMGEGQQVVLPPSIHPDTGRKYVWSREIDPLVGLPLIDLSNIASAVKVDDKTRESTEFDFVDIELDDVPLLPLDTKNLIRTGDGCSGDRSASLFKAVFGMLRSDMSPAEILSVLTDPTYYLGAVAFEHAKTKNRAIAARWLEKYTLRKCAEEIRADKDFNSEVEVNILGDVEAAHQAGELTGPRDWRDLIERTQDAARRPKNTLKNIELILENMAGPNVFRRDEFLAEEIYGVVPPWNDRKRAGDKIFDADIVAIKFWLAHNFRFEPSSDKIHDALIEIARKNAFHPIREYILGLEWDGVPRIDTWLKDYIGAVEPEPYLSDVSRKTLVAMIARVFNPGCKYDHVLILEGGQGIGKSTMIRHLASDPWFSDTTMNVADKDAVVNMRGTWCFELGELAPMRKAETELLKAFISRPTDKIRMPYGRRTEEFPRQCIFIGTTNADEYLKDETGNRRFWPVHVRQYDFEGLLKVRDQLFAEAKFVYDLGEPLYLENEKAREQASNEQNARQFSDELENDFLEFQARENAKSEGARFDFSRFTMRQLLETGGPFEHLRDDLMTQKRVASVLKKCGFEKKRVRLGREYAIGTETRREDGSPLGYRWTPKNRPPVPPSVPPSPKNGGTAKK